jgi:radical SAM superfamily enzyme YgiQ (UPF0313 family)
MKILLAVPPYNFAEFYPSYMARKTKIDKGFGLVPGVTEPLGLLYIASLLKNDGHRVWVIDSIFSSTKDLIKFVYEKEPALLGITVMSFSWEKAKAFLFKIKQHFPGLLTIVGGPFPTAWQERCLQECPSVDFVCIGEGEYVMQQLCSCLEGKRDLNKIKGLVWRNKSGRIINNGYAAPIENLDELPFPARELIDIRKYIPSIGYYKRLPNAAIVGSRGCSYNCLFCHTQTMGSRTRYRGPINVMDEIKELINKYKVKDILFWDNNLTENKERIHLLCQEILRARIKIAWSGNTRADTVDAEILRMMKKSGCRRLLLGVESGVQKNLDVLRKKETLSQIKNTVRLCKSIGIEIFATFIFGIPGETYDEALRTIKFACRLNPEYAKFFTLGCHPGTDLYKNLKQYGTIWSFKDAQSHNNAGFVPFTMEREELKELLDLAYRRFYLRRRYILMKISKIRSIEDLQQDIRGFLAFINIPRHTN